MIMISSNKKFGLSKENAIKPMKRINKLMVDPLELESRTFRLKVGRSNH